MHKCGGGRSTGSAPTLSELLSDMVSGGRLSPDPAQVGAARRLSRLGRALHLHGIDLERRDADADARGEGVHGSSEEDHSSRGGSGRGTNEDVASTSYSSGDDAGTATTGRPAPSDGGDNHAAHATGSEPEPAAVRIPRGLYLHGPVGTGKSMLMDLFHRHCLPPPFDDADAGGGGRRVHFHSFLQDVHARIHRLKRIDLETRGRDFHVDTDPSNDPIARVADMIADEVRVLCIDEFQVTDVADALILRRLFEVLWGRGVVVVATSNRPPEDLYEGGLNRNYFLPFIDLLRRYCVVHGMDSDVDHRLGMRAEAAEEGSSGGERGGKGGTGARGDFFFVADDDSSVEEASTGLLASKDDPILRHVFSNEDAAAAQEVSLPVAFNRTPTLRNTSSSHGEDPASCSPGTTPAAAWCRVHFDDLCDRDLGAADYRALAAHFPVVVLERIPILTLGEHDRARRFITLVDELYEARCALVCVDAAAPPERLFDHGRGDGVGRPSTDSGEIGDDEFSELEAGETLGIDVAQSGGTPVGELASVRELSFAFGRAASRLVELCSRRAWESNPRLLAGDGVIPGGEGEQRDDGGSAASGGTGRNLDRDRQSGRIS